MSRNANMEALLSRNASDVIGSATGASNAETCNFPFGVITTESLSTAQHAADVRTLTNSYINANSIVLADIVGGTNTTGASVTAKPGAGSATITIVPNSGALNGTVQYFFEVL